MDYLHLGAITIHTLAMILVVGYYGLLGRVILPALRRSLDGPTMAMTPRSVCCAPICTPYWFGSVR